MTGLTVITAVVVLLCLLRRGRFSFALAIGGATPSGAALIVGGLGVPTFYAVASLLLVGTLLAGIAGQGGPRAFFDVPGSSLFVAFLVWSVGVTLIAPFLFPGTELIIPTGGTLVPGQLTSSNIAQMGYLLLGICVFGYIARSSTSTTALLGVATGGVVLLSFWRYLGINAGLPFPEGLFDSSPTAAIIQTAPGGVIRFRGILSEPSTLAASCLACIAWAVPTAVRSPHGKRVAVLALGAVAAFIGTISTSTTFVVAGLVSLAAIGLILGVAFLAARVRIGTPAVLLGVVLSMVGLVALPYIADFATTAIGGKVGSSSYNERTGADQGSIELFNQTLGLGVGLGANRASSFLPSLATSVGLVGVLLFVLAIVSVVRHGARSLEVRPALWVLIVFFITKLIAGPDLSDPSGVVWIALGLLARSSRSSGGPDSDPIRLASARKGPAFSQAQPRRLLQRATPRPAARDPVEAADNQDSRDEGLSAD